MDVKPIRKSIRRVRKFLKKAPSDPVPEKVHDLRTSSRRLEATLEAFRLAEDSRGKKLLDDLRRIHKKAGKVRDMDVLTGQVLSLEAKPEEQDCLVEVIEHLGISRGKLVRKLHAATRKVRSRLRRELKRRWSELKPVLTANGNAAAAVKEARAQALAKELQLAGELRVPSRLNRHNLHPYRLKVKVLRYLLQIEDRRKQKKFVEKLGEVKDAIGEWHDWEELGVIAGNLLDHGRECRLLQAIKSTGDAKFEHALKVAEEMRKTFVKAPPPRAGKPSVKSAALAPPPVSIAV